MRDLPDAVCQVFTAAMRVRLIPSQEEVRVRLRGLREARWSRGPPTSGVREAVPRGPVGETLPTPIGADSAEVLRASCALLQRQSNQ